MWPHCIASWRTQQSHPAVSCNKSDDCFMSWAKNWRMNTSLGIAQKCICFEFESVTEFVYLPCHLWSIKKMCWRWPCAGSWWNYLIARIIWFFLCSFMHGLSLVCHVHMLCFLSVAACQSLHTSFLWCLPSFISFSWMPLLLLIINSLHQSLYISSPWFP